jgi:hypothetical protein
MLNRHQNFDISQLKEAVSAMQPEADTINAAFLEIFPVIQASLARGVTKKALLEKLASLGLKLHPVKFTALYNKALSQQKPTTAQTTRTSVGTRK